MKSRHLIFATVSLLLLAMLVSWWLYRPRKITQEFASHLSHERYEESAGMLRAPSSIDKTPEGGLVIVDDSGNSITVPAAQLPFQVGGGEAGEAGEFSMIALGESENGILKKPPVILYLRIEGGKVSIDRIDS